MNLIAFRPTNRNMERLPKPAYLKTNKVIKSLSCRWVLSGDTRLPVVCVWHFNAEHCDETLYGDIPIELSRCA